MRLAIIRECEDGTLEATELSEHSGATFVSTEGEYKPVKLQPIEEKKPQKPADG